MTGRTAASAGGEGAAPHLAFLDLVRFGSALLVAFGHTRGYFLASIRDVPDAGPLTKAFYVVTGSHHEAVILFFLISGFLVGGGLISALAAGAFEWRRYLVARFSRIYVVLLPGLALTALVIALGAALFADLRLYAERPLFPSGLTAGWTWPQVPCHLASLQTLFCAPFGFNPPLWSLGYEWALYLAAPLILVPLFLPAALSVRLALALLVGLSLFAWRPYLAFWMEWPLYWAVGAAMAVLLRRRPLPAAIGLAGLVLTAGAFVLARAAIVPNLTTDRLILVGFALALASPAVVHTRLVPRGVRAVADFSFSLYILHVPVGIFIGAALMRAGWPEALRPPDAASLSAFVLTMVGTLAVAWAFAQGTERQTGRLRLLIMRLWPGDPRPALADQRPRGAPEVRADPHGRLAPDALAR